jgi:hypothetical protein
MSMIPEENRLKLVISRTLPPDMDPGRLPPDLYALAQAGGILWRRLADVQKFSLEDNFLLSHLLAIALALPEHIEAHRNALLPVEAEINALGSARGGWRGYPFMGALFPSAHRALNAASSFVAITARGRPGDSLEDVPVRERIAAMKPPLPENLRPLFQHLYYELAGALAERQGQRVTYAEPCRS